MSACSFGGDPDVVTVTEARDWLRELVDDGAYCPLCTQLAKVYRRKIHATMARELIRIVRAGVGVDWFHLPTIIGHNGGDVAKLAYWAMLEEETVRRDDGGRAGWWRLLPTGIEWAMDRCSVPKYARIYDSRCLGLVGEPVTIVDALGDRFDYRELMEGL